MSNSHGCVLLKSDGLVLHFEYQGTSDIAKPTLFLTSEEVEENWRKDRPWRECKCGKDEEAWAISDYGGCIGWPTRACRFCMCLSGSLSPYDDDVEEQSVHYDARATDRGTLPGWYTLRPWWRI